MDDIFWSKYDPSYFTNQRERIYDRWTVPGKEQLRLIDGPAELVDFRDGRKHGTALLLSESLADSVHKALCITHAYWALPEQIDEGEKLCLQNETRMQSWNKELEHFIEVTKEEVRKNGKATREQRDLLRELFEEQGQCQKDLKNNQRHRQKLEDTIKLGKERWTNAWIKVQHELERVWVGAGQVKEFRHGRANERDASVPRRREPRARSRPRERRHRRQERSSGQDREHSSHYSPSRSRRHDDYRRRRGRNSPHRNAGHRNRPSSPASSHSHAQSDAELWRMEESICDPSEITPALLAITAKPPLDWKRVDGYRDEDCQVADRDITPSAIMADDVEQSLSDISIDDSVEAMAERDTTHSTPTSRQAQDFHDGLHRLTLEYNKRDTPSPKPCEPSEDLPYRPSGNKRKQEDHELSERKSRKVVEASTAESESSTCEVATAVDWAQEEPRVEAVAGRTPESMRMSIRDFFKPYQSCGESLC